MKRLTILELDALRACDTDVEPKGSLLYWIWDARRRGVISDDATGFFLTDEQMQYWKGRNMRLE